MREFLSAIQNSSFLKQIGVVVEADELLLDAREQVLKQAHVEHAAHGEDHESHHHEYRRGDECVGQECAPP